MSTRPSIDELIRENNVLKEQLAAERATVTWLRSNHGQWNFEQERLHGLMQALPEGVYIVNKRYDIKYINPVLKKEFGPVNGKKCFEYLHNRTAPCSNCKNKEVFAGKSIQREWHSNTNNKHYIIFDSPLKNANGELEKLAVFHDTTPMRQAAEALEKSRLLLESIINNSTAVIRVKDTRGAYLMANTRFIDLFNHGNRKIVGKNDMDFFPKEQAQVLQANDRKVLRDKQTHQFEETLRHGDGNHVYLSIIFPLVHSDGSVYAVAAISTDISARKQATEMIREKKKELEETNIALRVLLNQQKKVGEDIQQSILSQLEKCVFPYLQLLRQCLPDEQTTEYLDIISRHLRSVGESFTKKLSNPDLGLTRREILVADLVRQGKRTKEIAGLLGLQSRSVEAYRNKIRKKLHLNKKNISLKQYLSSTFTSEN